MKQQQQKKINQVNQIIALKDSDESNEVATTENSTSNDNNDKNSTENATSENDNNKSNVYNNSSSSDNNSNSQSTQNNTQSSNSAGQQTHVVSGNDNLYRIAIQYYGEGTVENVNKLKRANGLTSNNIVNGQN